MAIVLFFTIIVTQDYWNIALHDWPISAILPASSVARTH